MGPSRAGAVGAADDADGAGLRAGEAQQAAAHIGQEDAQLSRSAQQQALGIGDQGSEVGHGAHAHEDQARIDAKLYAQVQNVDQARAHGDVGEGHAVIGGGLLRLDQGLDLNVKGAQGAAAGGGDLRHGLLQHLGAEHRLNGGQELVYIGGQHVLGHAQLLHLCQERCRDRLSADQVPVDVAACKEDLVEHVGPGQVGHQHAKGDGHHQQGLELLFDAQVQQKAGDGQHDQVLPPAVLEQQGKACVIEKI